MKKLALVLTLVAGFAHAQTYNLFKPANGILKGQTSTYVTTAAAASDVSVLFSGTCNSTTYLRGDGACASPPGATSGTVTSVALTVPGFLSVSGSPITSSGTLAVSLSGTALPVANGGTGATTLTGPLKGNGTSAFSAAAAADMYGLWSGSCTSSTYLRGDGSCATPTGTGGSGPVTSVALTMPAVFSVSGSPVTTSGTLAVTASGTSGGIPYFSSSSALASSAALTANALVLGGGAGGTPTVVGSLGTTTTLLHGNASGAPTFSAVALGSDVSGTLLAAQFPALTGDVTTTAGSLATTAVNINGTSVPTNSAADQAIITTASATGAWKSLPACTDTGGNHLNYNTSTHVFSCGTSGATSGTVTTTGSPASGNLTKFSGAASVTNGDLSGDCTTSGTLAITCTKTSAVAFAASATTDTTSASNISSGTLAAARLPSNTKVRSFGTTFGDTGGSALTSGSIVYFTIPYTCTISAWNATVDAGTVTFDIWKIATGTAIPTVTNTITASALPAISTGTAKHSTTLTGWTTSVSANDIIGIKLQTVATAKYAELDVECDQ